MTKIKNILHFFKKKHNIIYFFTYNSKYNIKHNRYFMYNFKIAQSKIKDAACKTGQNSIVCALRNSL